MGGLPVVQCSTCGGQTELINRFVQVVVCSWCDQTLVLEGDAFRADGKTPRLQDLFASLATGAAGELDGRGFRVAGRIRFAWDRGYWDEWALQMDDGALAWLHEDEGELSLLSPAASAVGVDLDAARVGGRIPVEGGDAMVREKRVGRIEGGEGQIPRGVRFGQPFLYVDATRQGRLWMFERCGERVELFTGARIDTGALVVGGA